MPRKAEWGAFLFLYLFIDSTHFFNYSLWELLPDRLLISRSFPKVRAAAAAAAATVPALQQRGKVHASEGRLHPELLRLLPTQLMGQTFEIFFYCSYCAVPSACGQASEKLVGGFHKAVRPHSSCTHLVWWRSHRNSWLQWFAKR